MFFPSLWLLWNGFRNNLWCKTGNVFVILMAWHGLTEEEWGSLTECETRAALGFIYFKTIMRDYYLLTRSLGIIIFWCPYDWQIQIEWNSINPLYSNYILYRIKNNTWLPLGCNVWMFLILFFKWVSKQLVTLNG